MFTKVRFYRDQEDQPQVATAEEYMVMEDYLKNDLQDSATISDIIKIVEKDNFGGQKEITGNSYTVVLDSENVVLENQFNEDEGEAGFTLPLSEYKTIIGKWSEFLDKDNLISLVVKFDKAA